MQIRLKIFTKKKQNKQKNYLYLHLIEKISQCLYPVLQTIEIMLAYT